MFLWQFHPRSSYSDQAILLRKVIGITDGMRVNMLLSYHTQGWEQRINRETRDKNAFEEETEIDFLVSLMTTKNISAQCRMPKELHIYRQSVLWSTRTLALKTIFSSWLQSSHFLNSQVRKGMNAMRCSHSICYCKQPRSHCLLYFAIRPPKGI